MKFCLSHILVCVYVCVCVDHTCTTFVTRGTHDFLSYY